MGSWKVHRGEGRGHDDFERSLKGSFEGSGGSRGGLGLFGGGFGGLRSRSPIRRPRRSSAGPLKAMAGRARFGPLRGDPSKRFGILRVRFGSVRRRSGHCGCPRVRFGSVRRCSGHCRPLRVSSGSFGSFRTRSEAFGSLQPASGLFGSVRRCSGHCRPLRVSSDPFRVRSEAFG